MKHPTEEGLPWRQQGAGKGIFRLKDGGVSVGTREQVMGFYDKMKLPSVL